MPLTSRLRLNVFVVSVAALAGCSGAPPPDGGIVVPDSGAGDDAGPPDAGMVIDGGAPLGVPGVSTHTTTTFPTRPYVVRIPRSYDGVTPLPLVFVLHGGGGNSNEAELITCPESDAGSPDCFGPQADSRGFIVVYPNGTRLVPGPMGPNLRAWNSGGGDGGWQCVSSTACTDGVDEKAYFAAVLKDLTTVVHYDERRLFATGHSNGASMSERLACEFPGVVQAIASVAGGNQWSTTRACPTACAVIEIHGTSDPCWAWDGGPKSCADNNPGSKISVNDTVNGWRARNGCTGPETTQWLPDLSNDGTVTALHTWGCPRSLRSLRRGTTT